MPLMGIDYGSKRIGIAFSESGIVATAHSVLRNEGDILTAIERLAAELGADRFVVGLARRPRSASGEKRFRDFAEGLRQRTCKEVVLWDETLTTVEAAVRLRDAGLNRREAEKQIDMHAAAVILQSYLDEHPGRDV